MLKSMRERERERMIFHFRNLISFAIHLLYLATNSQQQGGGPKLSSHDQLMCYHMLIGSITSCCDEILNLNSSNLAQVWIALANQLNEFFKDVN